MQTMWSTQDIYKTIFFRLDLKLGSLLFFGGEFTNDRNHQPTPTGRCVKAYVEELALRLLGLELPEARSLWPFGRGMGYDRNIYQL